MHVNRVRDSGDEGFTLIELLVVMVLLGIIGGVIMSTSILAMHTTRLHQNRTYAMEDVQTQLERIARDIRVADPIRAASASSITIDRTYSTNSTCTRRTWFVSGTTLKVTTSTYAARSACNAYPATATPTSTTTKTALSSLGNGATPIFSYVDPTGAAMGNPVVSQIALVKVTILETVQGRPTPVSFTTSVGVRNESLA